LRLITLRCDPAAIRILISIVAASFFALSTAKAYAQVTAGAVIGPSTQSAGASDEPYRGPGFGGTSFAGVGMIDFQIGSHASFGGEVSLSGDISGAQTERVSGGSNTVVSDHHDTVFSGVLKVGTPSTGRVHAAAAIGGGFAQRHTERNGTFRKDFPPFTSSPVQETDANVVLAFTVGVDVAVGITEHVALLTVGRLFLLKDNDRQPDGVVHRGVSSTILRYGVGAQIRF
jgi:hypothetical protein